MNFRVIRLNRVKCTKPNSWLSICFSIEYTFEQLNYRVIHLDSSIELYVWTDFFGVIHLNRFRCTTHEQLSGVTTPLNWAELCIYIFPARSSLRFSSVIKPTLRLLFGRASFPCCDWLHTNLKNTNIEPLSHIWNKS